MSRVFYYDRKEKRVEEEKIYGEFFLKFFYSPKKCRSFFSKILLPIFTKFPGFSAWYASLQKTSLSRRKILPFVEKYKINLEDFVEPIESYRSFNSFFCRKIRPEAREIDKRENVAIMPADGRYLVFPNLSKATRYFIKGQKLSLVDLTGSEELAKKYEEGSMVIARLCPTDYHRFHFPFHCKPKNTIYLEGDLYSVNPLALRKKIDILSTNRKMITPLETELFGDVLYIEVGATAVGSIKQTFQLDKMAQKGEEKGYFEFGGSTVILLFEKDRIAFDEDLIEFSNQSLEVRAFFGESLGKAVEGFFRL